MGESGHILKPCAVSEMLLASFKQDGFGANVGLTGVFTFCFVFWYILSFLFCFFPFINFFLFPSTTPKATSNTRLKPWIPQIFCHWVCLLIQSASMDPFFAHYQDQDCKKRRQKEHLEGSGHSEKTRNIDSRWTATEDGPQRARQWFKDQL